MPRKKAAAAPKLSYAIAVASSDEGYYPVRWFDDKDAAEAELADDTAEFWTELCTDPEQPKVATIIAVPQDRKWFIGTCGGGVCKLCGHTLEGTDTVTLREAERDEVAQVLGIEDEQSEATKPEEETKPEPAAEKPKPKTKAKRSKKKSVAEKIAEAEEGVPEVVQPEASSSVAATPPPPPPPVERSQEHQELVRDFGLDPDHGKDEPPFDGGKAVTEPVVRPPVPTPPPPPPPSPRHA